MLASWLQAPIRWLAQAASRPQELHLQKRTASSQLGAVYCCPANFTHDLCARQFFVVPSRCLLTRNFKEAVLKPMYANHTDAFSPTLLECSFGNSGTLSASSHALSQHHVVSVQLRVRRLFCMWTSGFPSRLVTQQRSALSCADLANIGIGCRHSNLYAYVLTLSGVIRRRRHSLRCCIFTLGCTGYVVSQKLGHLIYTSVLPTTSLVLHYFLKTWNVHEVYG